MRTMLRSHVVSVAVASLLVILIGGAGWGAPAPENFSGEQLVVTIPGGKQEDDFTRLAFQPFEKLYNAKISIVEGSTFDILAEAARAARAIRRSTCGRWPSPARSSPATKSSWSR